VIDTSARNVKVIDQSRQVVAVGRVTVEADRFFGELDLRSMPVSLRQTFEEFEEIVNDQIFSLLDDIEERIRGLSLKVALEGSNEAKVEDFQLYPSTGLVSFRIAPSAAKSSAQ
jgi:hypothetical protein